MQFVKGSKQVKSQLLLVNLLTMDLMPTQGSLKKDICSYITTNGVSFQCMDAYKSDGKARLVLIQIFAYPKTTSK